MPLRIIRQDITKIKCDAIVDPTDTVLSGSGGTDRLIHLSAGPEMDKACKKAAPCRVGEAVITDGYLLPCRYVIHTPGPVWVDGAHGEKQLLESCYRSSLELAARYGCETLAFPLIASGTFGYPKDKVLRIAADVIYEFLLDNEMLVYICVFDSTAYELSEKLFSDVTAFIDEKYVSDTIYSTLLPDCLPLSSMPEETRVLRRREPRPLRPREAEQTVCQAPVFNGSVEEWLKNKDENFAVTLLKLIDRKGMTDVQCYKKANVSKKTFWKINNQADYRPSKQTVIAFAIALELSLDETQQLLRTVGFSLSHSSKADLIIEYFITRGDYDIFEINETLFKFDEVPLGC